MTRLSRRNFLKTSAAAGLATLPAGVGLVDPSEGGPDARAREPDGPGAGRGARADDPLGVRDKFPVTQELAYLNTASVGPLSIPVRDALHAYADEKMRRRNTSAGREAIAGARSRFAGLFGTDEDEVAFLYATSGAENIIVSAMDWRAGDNVVVDELHFTTTFVLYRELERRAGVELRIIPPRDGVVTVDDFAAHTDARTRLISVAWVSNRNGFRYDLPPWPTSRTPTAPTSTPTRSRPGAPSPPTCATRTSTSPAATGTSGCTPTSGALPSTSAASTWSG